jgi:Domain of unknown function (DUF4062)
VSRVFLSHTSELRAHPEGRSFLAAAEAGVQRAGSAVIDMEYFTASDHGTAAHCLARIAEADVYVGIIGLRYGSPVRDRPQLSYTELEFEEATRRRLPRLVFLLDDRHALPLPAEQLIDLTHGHRQAEFRDRLRAEAGLTVAFVSTPQDLETRVLQALYELCTSTLPAVDAPSDGASGRHLATPDPPATAELPPSSDPPAMGASPRQVRLLPLRRLAQRMLDPVAIVIGGFAGALARAAGRPLPFVVLLTVATIATKIGLQPLVNRLLRSWR